MEVNAASVVKVLTKTSETIVEAKKAVESGGITAAMGFINPIMSQFGELQNLGKLESIQAKTQGSSDVQNAINQFLSNAKEIEDAVGPMGAAVFSKPEVVDVKANLQAVLSRLEEEKRKVTGIDTEGSV